MAAEITVRADDLGGATIEEAKEVLQNEVASITGSNFRLSGDVVSVEEVDDR